MSLAFGKHSYISDVNRWTHIDRNIQFRYKTICFIKELTLGASIFTTPISNTIDMTTYVGWDVKWCPVSRISTPSHSKTVSLDFDEDWLVRAAKETSNFHNFVKQNIVY